MKKFKGLSILCACVLALGQTAFISAAEETESDSAAVSSTEGLYKIIYKLDGGTGRVDVADPVEKNEYTSVSVWALRKDGYAHTGWTDGEKTYNRGARVKMPDHDIVLYPVWKKIYTLTYESLEQYGYPSTFADGTVSPGTSIYLPNYAMFNGDKRFNGWLVNGEHYDPLTYFDMPEQDTYVCVDWASPIVFAYDAGDVDGVVGTSRHELTKYPGSKYELSDSTKLSRIGYKLSGWYYKEGNQKYDLEQTFVIPDTDTTMYAVWTPVKAGLTFKANGGTGTMKRLIYDNASVINIPECQFVNEGFKLLGWKLGDAYYLPGAEYQVKLVAMGEDLKFEAVWIEEDKTPGDINGDGNTDLTDLSELSMYLLNDTEFTDEKAAESADVLADGEVNLADLSHYKQFIMQDKILLGMKGE